MDIRICYDSIWTKIKWKKQNRDQIAKGRNGKKRNQHQIAKGKKGTGTKLPIGEKNAKK